MSAEVINIFTRERHVDREGLLSPSSLQIARDHATSMRMLKRRILAELKVPRPIDELTHLAGRKRVVIALTSLLHDGLVEQACTIPDEHGVWRPFFKRVYGGSAA